MKFCKTQSSGSTAKMVGHTDTHTDSMVISYTHFVSLMKEVRLKMKKRKEQIAEKGNESKEAERKGNIMPERHLNTIFKQCSQSI